MRTRLQFIFRGAERKARNINAGEIRGRKALWRDIASNTAEHRRRHLVVYDSAATVGAASKGRSPAFAMMKELRLTYPHILAADCAEGALWCESEMNAADHGSRGRKLGVPAPRRAWVHEFFEGSADALDCPPATRRFPAVQRVAIRVSAIRKHQQTRRPTVQRAADRPPATRRLRLAVQRVLVCPPATRRLKCSRHQEETSPAKFGRPADAWRPAALA